MDPARDLPILPPLVERTRRALSAAGINPVVDPVNIGQIFLHEVRGSAVSPVRESDKDMHQNVTPPAANPWHKVFDDPFLVPSPLLAAFAALPALLGHWTGLFRNR